MMTDKMQLDDALTKAETCLEKLSHLIESFTVMYNLNDTREMDEISVRIFACKKDGMRIDTEILEDYVNKLTSRFNKVREVLKDE